MGSFLLAIVSLCVTIAANVCSGGSFFKSKMGEIYFTIYIVLLVIACKSTDNKWFGSCARSRSSQKMRVYLCSICDPGAAVGDI